MAYAVYYRKSGDKVYARVTEFYKPTRRIKFYYTTDDGEQMGIRDLRCETFYEANEVANAYRSKGYETKIKAVK